jgi:hypothetical protein
MLWKSLNNWLQQGINRLCTTVLIAGRIDQKQILDDRSIRKAIAEIDQR